MDRIPATNKQLERPPGARVGRPLRGLVGEVDERILDAARRVFLERGLTGASINEIARLARAAKRSIYARFPNKEALFTAVGTRNVADILARFESHVPTGPFENRLVRVGTNILECLLVSDVIDFMRLSVAEAHRFPALASLLYMARERAAQTVTQVLRGVAHPDDIGSLAAFAPECLATTARFFVDLVVARLLMRGLFGERTDLLRAEIDVHVTRCVSFFLAECRNGGVS